MKNITVLLITALFLAGCSSNQPIPPTGGTPSTTPPTGHPPSDIDHVFIIMMENHSYDQVWNNPSAPYIASLGSQYARATAYHSLIHPSLPNYLQLVSGSNGDITTDCSPSDSCHVNANSIADSLEAAGRSWKAYLESMPAPCTMKSSDPYYPKHNPFLYFDNIRGNLVRCAAHDVPYTNLQADLLTKATTPNFAFVVPNECNDMHDCSVATGDTWLKNNVPAILNSPACTSDKCLVVITWDEAELSSSNQVLTIFAGSAAKTGGFASAADYTHYSLLRTVEAIFGLPTLTANAAAAPPMTDMLK